MKKLSNLIWSLLAVVGLWSAVHAAQTCVNSDVMCYESGPSQNLFTQARIDAAGNLTTGNNATIGGLIVPTAQQVQMVAGTQITPLTSYLLLLSSTSITATATPTISTSIAPNGAAYPDGTFLVVSATSAATTVTLQDNGTLANSRLFLNNTILGSAITKLIVSSTQTVTFQYNASSSSWNLIR